MHCFDQSASDVAADDSIVDDYCVNNARQLSAPVKSLKASPPYKASAPGKKRMQLPPVTEKTYTEAPYEASLLSRGTFDSISLKRVPPISKSFEELRECSYHYCTSACQPQTQEKPLDFLLIKESDFPNLFDNPVVKKQKMTKFFDEQDFNSDLETIELNKIDLLKQLEQTINRAVKGDPTKFVQNLKEHATEVKAGDLKKHVDRVDQSRKLPHVPHIATESDTIYKPVVVFQTAVAPVVVRSMQTRHMTQNKKEQTSL